MPGLNVRTVKCVGCGSVQEPEMNLATGEIECERCDHSLESRVREAVLNGDRS